MEESNLMTDNMMYVFWGKEKKNIQTIIIMRLALVAYYSMGLVYPACDFSLTWCLHLLDRLCCCQSHSSHKRS